MSTLQVANLHFESTGNNRFQYTGSNSYNIVAGGTTVATVNSTSFNLSASFSANGSTGSAGQVLISSGASSNVYWGILAGRLLRAPQILTSGTSYTTPANCTAIYVECVGGGGGGGAISTTTGSGGAGGGGSGGYAAKYFSVTPSTAYSYTIGAGGAGGLGASGTSGSSGGDTTFVVGGTTLTAGGGGGGQGGVYGSSTSGGFPEGGAGGTSVNGDINIQGTGGSVGLTGSAGVAIGGQGGAGFFGGAARSRRNTAPPSSGPGSGGAGAMSAGGSNYNAPAGGDGIIRIWELA